MLFAALLFILASCGNRIPKEAIVAPLIPMGHNLQTEPGCVRRNVGINGYAILPVKTGARPQGETLNYLPSSRKRTRIHPPPMPLPVRTVNVGVNALAREVGLSPSNVSAQLKRGKTPDQIRREAKMGQIQRQRMEKIKALAAGKLPAPKNPKSGKIGPTPSPSTPPAQTDKTYVPSRLMSKQTVTREVDPEFNGGDEDAFDYDSAVEAHKQAESLEAARLRRAVALANEKELQNAMKIRELVPRVQVRNWGTKCMTAFRDRLMQSASELQDELAAETRPGRVREKLEQRFRLVLEEVYQLEELWGSQSEVSEKEVA